MSIWLRTFQLGVKGVLLHPLRSLLTILGIFVGVASVIWLLAIGEGIGAKAQEQIASLGANNIIVRTIKPDIDVSSNDNSPIPHGITRDDFVRLRDTIHTIDEALSIREMPQLFSYKTRALRGRLVGCTPQYDEVTRLKVARGHFISPPELTNKENICVLAAGTAEKLFPYEDPLGQSIHIGQSYYDVVGVMEPRAPSAGIGGSLAAQDYSNDVYIPISTLWVRIGDVVAQQGGGSFAMEIVELSQVTLRVDDVEHVVETAGLVRDTLAAKHHLDDFAITIPLELLEQAKTTKMLFMLFMGLIAAISLLVGGIGIMNIMLATVTERTREIGIRRALGAKRSDITRQFLVETVVLSVAGGLTGILGGITCGPLTRVMRTVLEWAVPEAMKNLPEVMQTVEPVLVPWSMPLAFIISVVIGVLFGLYPAARAAGMDPVEALRHE